MLGVYLSDRQARFSGVLAGSAMGLWAGAMAINAIRNGFPPSVAVVAPFVCPLAGATIMSELWRDASEGSRLSICLDPDLKGRLSAVATLRF